VAHHPCPRRVSVVVVAAAAGGLIMGPGGIPVGMAFGGLVNGVTRLFVEKLGYGTQETGGIQIDQYRNSISTFRSRPTPTNSRKALSERVELLFGRRLAAAA